MQILFILLQSYHISTSFMHRNIHQKVTSVLICLNRCLWRTILGKFILYSWNTRTTSFCQFQFLQEITKAIILISAWILEKPLNFDPFLALHYTFYALYSDNFFQFKSFFLIKHTSKMNIKVTFVIFLFHLLQVPVICS